MVTTYERREEEKTETIAATGHTWDEDMKKGGSPHHGEEDLLFDV